MGKETAPSDAVFAMGEMAMEQARRICELESDLARLTAEHQELFQTNRMGWRKVDALRAENAGLREALEFYADEASYDANAAPGTMERHGNFDRWKPDCGWLARAAMEDKS